MCETNFSTLKELILDEQKLITYVSLSRTLCIHVNESKILLNQVVTEIKKTSDVKLNLSYIISGITNENKARTIVYNEQDSTDIRKHFKIIFFDHIYSVCKGGSSIDKVAFLACNRFEDLPLCVGLIKSKISVQHTSEEIANFKSFSVTNSNVEPKIPKSELKTIKTNKTESSATVPVVNKGQETKTVSEIRKETISPVKNINNFKQTDTKLNKKSQQGIAGFFSRSNPVNSKKVKEVNPTTIKKEVPPEISMNEKAQENTEIDKTSNTEVKEKGSKSSGNKLKNVEKKLNSLDSIKKNGKVDAKRKRVLHISDSESEEESNVDREIPVNNDSEDEIPPTPSVSSVSISAGLVNPKKRRKVVDKTYTDEDGYILTKKEEVYESCSENEEYVIVKENKQQNSIKKVSPEMKKDVGNKKKKALPQKGKQATLMTFFKKA